MPNNYVEAIHRSDREAQLKAFCRFAEEQVHDLAGRLDSIENENGVIPEESREEWSRVKGQLDAYRLMHGMFVQAYITASEGGIEEMGDPPR